MNIGTKMEAKSAHFPFAEPMNRLMKAVRTTNNPMRIGAGSPSPFNPPPQITAITVAILLEPNTEMNWKAKKQIRKKLASVPSSFCIIGIVSPNFLIVPAIFPYT